MKIALSFVASVLICAVYQVAAARELPPSLQDGSRGYSAVVAVEGVPAAQLYARAKAWVAVAYRSAQSVIQLDDPANGKLIVKGVFSDHLDNAFAGHTLTIETKEGRYRYLLTDFRGRVGAGDKPLEEVSDPEITPALWSITVQGSRLLIDDLARAMLAPANDPNW